MKYNDQDIWESKRLEADLKITDYFEHRRNSTISAIVAFKLIQKYLAKEEKDLASLILYIIEIQPILTSLMASGKTEVTWPNIRFSHSRLLFLGILLKNSPHFREWRSKNSKNSPVKIQSILDNLNKVKPNLESQLMQTLDSIDKLNKFSPDEMLDFYYKNVHNSRVAEGSQILNSFVNSINEHESLIKSAHYNRS